MDLQYKAVNKRGRVEWIEIEIELELVSSLRPEGLIIEEWQVKQYRPFVHGIRDCIGRDLTEDELSTIAWLATYEQSTVDKIMGVIRAAYEHGKNEKN
ncbi:hypothetical protein B5G50_15480 [Brevibacillus brevis]|nr:hypothetical protein B5G50_15480 [Brevibacillus brevis]